ncbi:MAG: hypothetical protein WD773_07640 [Gemmatimonadales bacterium]
MPAAEWVTRLSTLVKRYAPKTNGAAFRNDFGAILDSAFEQGGITREERDLLLRARSYLESWSSAKRPQASEAYAQWMELYQVGKDSLPTQILTTFLGRFPKTRGVDWTHFIIGASSKELLSVLLTRHLIHTKDLVSVANERPAEFFRSPGLDLLVELNKPCPRDVWNALSKGEGRPSGLLNPAEAIARSFAADRKKDAVSWFLGFLADSGRARKSIFRSVLERPEAALRLAAHISPMQPNPRAKRPKKQADVAVPVLTDWLATCQQALEESGTAATTASVVLGLLELSVVAKTTALPHEVLKALSATMERMAERTILLALRGGEVSGGVGARNDVVVVRGNDLYRAVQEYLRSLPAGSQGDLESPERSLRFERYKGRREVIEGLLAALERASEQGLLRDAVEAVLFNSGVRSFGAPGEDVSFDVHSHEADVSGMLPGSQAVVTRAGRRLGNEEDGIVLVKARVKPKH